jgi:hypothetical protein
MRTRSKKILAFLALVALTAVSTLAMAQTPGRVGRIALIQGQVSVAGDSGEGFAPALLNWPVTTSNQITTGRDARTEIKIGSTAIRLDGDSSLEVTELDDDSIRLHLHYGSVNVNIRNPEALPGFRLTTPQGQVRMQEPGRLRVDAERVRDTTVVNVFDGVALVDGNASSTTVRANRRAELQGENMLTGLASRDSFDDWAYLRDQRDERVTSDRYVTREMTGYEDLDQFGVWRDDREYGPLWLPRSVPANWAPYRDGRWAWVAPWGWTWVDNAPWGYAPFHYGRWVEVNKRWCWAPGRTVSRPVWAPALVGWVGGSNWQLSFSSGSNLRPAPATGWYPLGPRHVYTPAYKVAPDHLRWINRNAHPDDHHVGGPDRRYAGLTVVPHEQFSQHGTVVVPNAPRAVVSNVSLQAAPVAVPPAPLAARNPDPRWNRDERGNRNGNDRNDRFNRPAPQPSPAAPLVSQPQPQIQQAPVQQPAHVQRDPRSEDRNDRDRNEWRGRNERPVQQAAPVAPIAVQPPQSQQQPQPQAAPVARSQPPREEFRRDDDGRMHGRPSYAPQQPAQAQVQQQPQQAPQQFNHPQPQQAQPQQPSRPPAPVFAPTPQQQAPQPAHESRRESAPEGNKPPHKDKGQNDHPDR